MVCYTLRHNKTIHPSYPLEQVIPCCQKKFQANMFVIKDNVVIVKSVLPTRLCNHFEPVQYHIKQFVNIIVYIIRLELSFHLQSACL